MFLNTVEKSLETMRAAGFDTALAQSADENSYTLTVRIAKRAGVVLSKPDLPNVSRETLGKSKPKPRFSSALSIFEAIAEDERELSEIVSRETFGDGQIILQENVEKLELCID